MALVEFNRFTPSLLAASIIFGLLGHSVWSSLCQSLAEFAILKAGFFTLLGLPILLALYTAIGLALVPISEVMDLFTAVKVFYLYTVFLVVGKIRMYMIEKTFLKPVEVQSRMLMKLLKKNSVTEYGKRFHFGDVTSREDFREKVPLTTFDNYKEYIDRLEKGENGLLTVEPVSRFFVSSGTTGKAKLLPATSNLLFFNMWQMFLSLYAEMIRRKNAPLVAPLNFAYFILTPNWRFTETTKTPIGPASSLGTRNRNSLTTLGHTLPFEAEVYQPEQAQWYLHWRFALADRELARVDGVYGGGLLGAFEVFIRDWKLMAEDIRLGRISAVNGISQQVIDDIMANNTIKPDPQRAHVIERECSQGFKGIIQRLFPRVANCSVGITGAHSIHRERIQWLLGEKISIKTYAVGASEGVIGMNLDKPYEANSDYEQIYTLAPEATFFEFIPIENCDQPNPKTLFIDQIEVGKQYEVVMTNELGYYRYRIGDILEIVGKRHGKTPTFRILARTGSLLDLNGEKTSDDVILAALKASLSQWEGCNGLVDYTTSELTTSYKALFGEQDGAKYSGLAYVIIVELDGIDRALTSEEADRFDAELLKVAERYKYQRDRGTIGKPKVVVVAKGTFNKLMLAALERNKAVSNQYKTPRYIKDPVILSQLFDAALPSRENVAAFFK